jgi:hypothetical protein
VEGKTRLHGSILCTLNFSATCAAKSFSSICRAVGTVVGVLPSQPFHPTMNSRNGYAATETRSLGAEGNLTEGSERPVPCANSGTSQAPAAAPAHAPRNCLRLVGFMRASVTEKFGHGCDAIGCSRGFIPALDDQIRVHGFSDFHPNRPRLNFRHLFCGLTPSHSNHIIYLTTDPVRADHLA